MLDNQRFRSAATVAIASFWLAAAGCGSRDQIEAYSVLKEDRLNQFVKLKFGEGEAKRMLVAIVPDDNEYGWYFKILDDEVAVASVEKTFRDFVNTIRIESGEPLWTLPSGWKEAPGGMMRDVTIVVPADGRQLELAVSRNPLPEQDREQYLLANVNRWRGQLDLGPTRLQSLPDQLEKIEVHGRPVVLLDLVSGRADDPAPEPDLDDIHAGVPGFGEPEPGAGGGRKGFDESLLTCDPPTGWTAAPLTSFRSASYEVSDGEDKKLVITVTSVAGGSVLDNVNRWRGQVGLGPIEETELKDLTTPIDVGPLKGTLVELIGPADASPRKTALVVTVVVDDRPWYIKLIGDADLAAREKARFEAFAKSVKFK